MKLTSYAHLYHIHKSPVAKAIRVIIFLALLIWIGLSWQYKLSLSLPIFFLSCFLMTEVFYWYKVKRTVPKLVVSKNNKNVYESFTLHALDVALFSKNTKGLLKILTAKKYVRFILKKANIQITEIPIIDISFNEIAKKAFDIVEELDGSFITMMDLLVAYLLITEPQTQFLFNKHLREEDMMHILLGSL